MPPHKKKPTPKDEFFEHGRQLLQDAENSTNPKFAKLRAKAAKRYFDADVKGGSEMSTNPMGSSGPNPLEILKLAIKAVPPVKYALAVGGIVAVIVIVIGFRIDIRIAVFGTVIMLVLMTAVVVFARLTTESKGSFHAPAVVFMWFAVLLTMASALTVFLSIFFGWPLDLRGTIQSHHSETQEQPKSEIEKSTNPQPSTPNKQAPVPQLPTLTLINCQPIGTQDSVSVNLAFRRGSTFTSFYTEGKEQTVPFLRRPERLYVEPPGKTVAALDLPAQIILGKCGDQDCKITIKEFADKGVVVDTSAAIVLTEKRETCGVQVKMTMLDAAGKPIASGKPLPATAQPRKPEPQEPEPSLVSAPNGIAIGGGNVTNPTVNNFGPIPPIPTFKLLDKQPLPESAAPQRWIRIAIDRTFLDPKFAVLCDRPCKVLRADVVFGPNGGTKQVSWGTIPDNENIGAISINQPNPMPSDDTVEAVIASEDDKLIKILGVRVLVITPPKR